MLASSALNCNGSAAELCCTLPVANKVNVAVPLTTFLTGFCGNVLALTALYKSRTDSQRTVFYTLLTGLIITHLFGQVSTSILPLATYALSHVNYTAKSTRICFLGGHPTCYLHAFFMITISLVTPCFVAFMALERVLCLKRWYLYSLTVTKRRAYAVIAAMWAVSAGYALLPHLGIGAYALQFPGTWCFLDSHNNAYMSGYTLTYATINCLLILLIVVCNVLVIFTLLQVRRTRRGLMMGRDRTQFRKKLSADLSSIVTKTHNTFDTPSTKRRISGTILCACARLHGNLLKDLEIQMVVLLGAITVAFTVCWMPLMVSTLGIWLASDILGAIQTNLAVKES